jgi:protein TonB
MEALYRGRDWVAGLPSLIVVLALFLLSAQTMVPPRQERSLPPLEISLATLPEPTPEPEPPKPMAPPEPKPPEPVKQAQARPQAAPPQAAAPSVPVAATPSTSEPATVPAAPARPVETTSAAETAPPPPAPSRSSASTESSFIGKVRAQLEAAKRYPTGREASTLRPRGKSRVWFVLPRTGGEATESGVDDSSGSILLDNAALATVRRGRFPVFPEDAWPGRASHRFTAELDYAPAE